MKRLIKSYLNNKSKIFDLYCKKVRKLLNKINVEQIVFDIYFEEPIDIGDVVKTKIDYRSCKIMINNLNKRYDLIINKIIELTKSIPDEILVDNLVDGYLIVNQNQI